MTYFVRRVLKTIADPEPNERYPMFKIALILAFVFFGRAATAAEFYLAGSGGSGFYGSNSPTDYYETAKQGASTASTSSNSAVFDFGGGAWLTDSLGLELQWEFGTSANLSATYFSGTISENISLGAFLVAPQYRLRFGSLPLAWVVYAPLGWEYVTGNSAITGGGAYTYDISGGTFTYGVMTRLEYDFGAGVYGLLGGGYMAADMPNFTYTSSSSAGGSNQALTTLLNKNTGANASGARFQIGIGYRFGSHQSEESPMTQGAVTQLPTEDESVSAANAFYQAEAAFDQKDYPRAASLYGQVPASFARVPEARTKCGICKSPVRAIREGSEVTSARCDCMAVNWNLIKKRGENDAEPEPSHKAVPIARVKHAAVHDAPGQKAMKSKKASASKGHLNGQLDLI